MSSGALLTQQNIDEYASDGATCLRGVLNPEWIEVLSTGMDRAINSPSERHRYWNRSDGGETTFYDSMVWQENPEYRDFIVNSPMAELAGRTMGVRSVNFFFDAVFVRSLGSQFRTPFHQDEPFWSVQGFDCSSAWTPLVSVEKQSALEFVKGSHLWSEKFAQTNFGDLTKDERDNVAYKAADTVPFPDIEGCRDDYEILSWDMEPGDVALFNARMIHGGSGLLKSDRDLRVFNTQWLGDDVKVCFKPEGMDPDHSQLMTEAGLSPGDRVGTNLYPQLWESAS